MGRPTSSRREGWPESWRLALTGLVVRRALRVAVVVGGVLVLVNHGDAVLDGQVTTTRAFQVIVTMFVPYAVSTYSSVRALTDRQQSGGDTTAATDTMMPQD